MGQMRDRLIAGGQAGPRRRIGEDVIDELQDQGFVRRDGNRIAATARGRLVLNAVIEKLAEVSLTFPLRLAKSVRSPPPP